MEFCDRLLIRRSQVRALVGEPIPHWYGTFLGSRHARVSAFRLQSLFHHLRREDAAAAFHRLVAVDVTQDTVDRHVLFAFLRS